MLAALLNKTQKGNNGLLSFSDWGSKCKVRTFDFFEHVKIYALFWEDQIDPKSALGGPKPI